MKHKWMIGTLILLLLGITGLQASENLVSVAHVSYLNGHLTVINRDGNQHQAVVNFPLMAGDIIRTGDKDRGEIQFGNGTLLRMDSNSELLVGTIMAPMLSSADKRVTTLEAKKGRFYVISNTYNQELLQLVSDDAAVFFPHNSNVELFVDPELGTEVVSHWGKAELLITLDNSNGERKAVVKGKTGARVNKNQEVLLIPYLKGGAFMAWNQFVDNHFRQLHQGKSYVPDKIVRHAHLQLWAERWSSLFGEWVYDKLLGYVWKPNGFEMDPTRRPFYSGNVVTLNGEQYVIPNEPWGWAPAHLGTWVFLKKWGWTWIPGEGSGDIFMPRASFFYDFLCHVWGSPYLYGQYLNLGEAGWRRMYRNEFGYYPNESSYNSLPPTIRRITKKLELTHSHRSVEFIKQIQDGAPQIKGKAVAKNRENKVGHTPAMGGTGSVTNRVLTPVNKGKPPIEKILSAGQALQLRHDWNPDRYWASKNRVQMLYSAQSNSVIVPQMQLDSRTLTSRERNFISRTVNRDSYTSSGRSSQSSQSSGGSGTGNVSSGSSSKEIK